MNIQAADFHEQVLESKEPVLLDFYADWCAPCRMLAPILKKVAQDYTGKAKVVKVNVDQHPDLASEFGVSGIPAMFLVNKGQVVWEGVGLRREAEIRSALDAALAK